MRGKKQGAKAALDLKTDIVRAGTRYLVSTVLLPKGMAYEDYETMVFPYVDGEVKFLEVFYDRYDTVAKARRGHQKTVATWKPRR